MMVRFLLTMAMALDHAALPADTLMVDPGAALLTQLATLARSGVLVHVGFDPAQAADAGEAPQGANTASTTQASRTLHFVICLFMCFSPSRIQSPIVS